MAGSWSRLGPSGAAVQPERGYLERSGGGLGCSGGGLGRLLGRSWAYADGLGTSGDGLGLLLAPLWMVWDRSWKLYSRSWAALGAFGCVKHAILYEKTKYSAECIFLEREGYF